MFTINFKGARSPKMIEFIKIGTKNHKHFLVLMPHPKIDY